MLLQASTDRYVQTRAGGMFMNIQPLPTSEYASDEDGTGGLGE
jgi:hypothetical protein